MKWILAIVLALSFCVAAEARPHLRGKLRGWRHNHRRHVTAVVSQPKCECCGDNCKCAPACKCVPLQTRVTEDKRPCYSDKKENLLWKKKKK
jgi:hypothetical protein